MSALSYPCPELFTVPPKQPLEKKPGQLSSQQIQHYFSEGFLVVDDFFDVVNELDPCRDAINEFVDELADVLYANGKIKDTYKSASFFERLTLIENEYPGANVILHKFGEMPEIIRKLWSNDRLLNIIEQLIGPDIAGHPVWNLRTKTPKNTTSTVPWHQDVAYLDRDSYIVHQPTAWIPFLDADESNGCLQLIRAGHRKGLIAKHTGCWKNTWYVELDEKEMEKTLGVSVEKDIVTCPVKYGSMILFNNMLPHRSLPNRSDKIRWSVDLRWQTPLQPYGFHGLKDGLPMRSVSDPTLKIDWDSFFGPRRQFKLKNDGSDTINPGPWINTWEITHENENTRFMKSEKEILWHGLTF
ncbi:uncharacterized protein LOC141899211 [Tubulanus polymorphus]|uniref:uncharacterized protein LOC141899211 n=1 Tax=Tubulanus polymorphus TaxID=672921 RepID=UPI003DA64DE5